MALASFGTLQAQIADPIPQPLPSGLSVRIEPWLTIPASSGSSVAARINHVKPCPDGTRLFCNDLRGKLWVIEDKNASTANEFLDLEDHFPSFIDLPGLGAGFTSFDFHPEFATLAASGYGKFYTSHTETESGTPDFEGPETDTNTQVTIITEWTMADAADNAITLAPDNFTRREILRFGFPHHFHGIQEIAFDPTAAPGSDNYGCLFICAGDGGALVPEVNEPLNTGRIDSALGTILRITPVLANSHDAADFTLSANGDYLIPESNPFFSAADPTPGDGVPVVREVFAYGFRNPHRISWDSGGTHKMFCGNIGENSSEEIELVEPGTNHGWPNREGSFLFDSDNNQYSYPLPFPDTGDFRYPVSQYDHDQGNFAVVGGFVYRGTAIPTLQGKYLFGDIASGRLFVTDEADMAAPTSTSTGGTPAPPQSLGIESDGTSTTFLAILGRSRADLRFGIDHENEIYLLSKQTGTIFKVLPDPDPSGTAAAPIGSGDDWTSVLNFENGEHGLTTLPLTSSQVVDDPIEGPANRVLRICAAGDDTLSAYVPIPEIPDDSYGTVFFRFLITDTNHDADFGISDQAAPASTDDLATELRSGDQNSAPPNLELRDNDSFDPVASLIPHQWYSVWMVIDSEDDVWDFYIQGGDFTAPTLIRTHVPLFGDEDESLKSFFWQLSPGSVPANTSAIYFDDLQVDVGHANDLSPLDARWHLVDHFESENPLDHWQLPDSASQSNTIVSDTDGNHYLSRSASSSDSANPLAIAARELPFPTQVGPSVTLFLRVRIDSSDILQSLGLSAINPPDPAAYTEDSFAPQLRISPLGALDFYDGVPATNDFVATAPSLLDSNTWYKIWLVCSNRGIASGGQVWRAWIKGGDYPEPTPLDEELYFRTSAEAPITHFLMLATSLENAQNDPLCLDDIYLFPGATLDDPLGAVPVPASIEPLSRSSASITSPTRPNRALQFLTSEDLSNWSPTGDFVEGDGSDYTFEQPLDCPRRFFQAFEPSPLQFFDTAWSTGFPGPGLPRGLQLSPGSTWTPGVNILTLNTNTAQVPGMVRRPGAYALAPGEWRNLDLTVETRTLEPDTLPQRDVCLIFGYRDETHFYYVHLSSLSDGTFLNVILKVSGSTRSVIQTPAMPLPSITSAWHEIRLTHAANGVIAVYLDDDPTPRMLANDTDYPSGRVGFGSFDDSAEFRLFDISGQCR